jgi:hypothetical protein
MADIEAGVLLVADISGYTRFVSDLELTHASEIVADLLGAAVDQLAAVAPLAKLEGDAAFCVAHGAITADALMAALVGCYDGFRRRRRDARHLATCPCAACSNIGSLDLEVVVHHGGFVAHTIAGREEITGPGAIVVHRLLKNSAAAASGLRGYALLSAAVVEAASIPIDQWGCERLTDAADDAAGGVDVYVLDLGALWQAEQDRIAVVVGDDAPTVMAFSFPAPPPVLWEWFGDPRKRVQWNLADRIDVKASSGPSGVGTQNHCLYGGTTIDEEIVDWKPYRYCTLRVAIPAGRFLMTARLDPDGDGTRVEIRIRPETRGVRGLRVRLARAKIRRDFTAGMERLGALLA